MPPRITNPVAWQQAELLMQPAFIRVIDHIRKQLDQSTWKGTYQDVLIWPSGTTDETKEIVTQLLQQLETATPAQAVEVEQMIAQLATPHPGYYLTLQRQDQQSISVDLWELCYQVCFRNYIPSLGGSTREVEIDTSMIDEGGDVNWQHLDTKAGQLVGQVFANLSTD